MDSEDKEKGSKKKAGGRRKKTLARKRTGEKKSEESMKKQKLEDGYRKEERKAYLESGSKKEFANGQLNLLATIEMLDDFDRHDGDLKILFEPDEEDEVWRNQHEYNLISWRLFDSCGIHILLMNNGIAIHMMIEKKYPLTQEMLSKMLSKKLEVDHENEMEFKLLSHAHCSDLVMSDSEDSTVTYTEVSGPFEDLSDIGSSGVDGLSMMLEDPYVEADLQAPPSPDYVPGLEYPPLPEFVPESVYPEFMPPEDEVFPAEEQPLPVAVLPTTDSPRYIADSDPKEDEEDPEEDPVDYPADGGDDDDDD
ncbi:hypothetical protein Tco_0639463 [Tanacetum coccineum]